MVLDVSCPEIAFTVFDLRRWQEALEEAAEGDMPKKDLLLNHAQTCLKQWKLSPRQGARELESAARFLVRALGGKRDFDNRTEWRKILDSDVAAQIYSVPMSVLPTLVSIYLCAMDGTGQVERDLGRLSNILSKHSGPTDQDGELASYTLEVLLDGPQDESGFAEVDEAGQRVDDDAGALRPTDLTRSCARLWVALHGRRFGLYRPRQKKSQGSKGDSKRKRLCRPGTLGAILQAGRLARDMLAARSAAQPAAEGTIFGVPRSALLHRPLDQPLGPLLTKFAKGTKDKRQALRALTEARAHTRKRPDNPYALGSLNPEKRLRRGPPVSSEPAHVVGVPRDGTRQWKVLDCTAGGVAPLPQVRCVVARGTDNNLWPSLQRADVVLVDSVWELDNAATLSTFLLKVYFIVACQGVGALPRAAWVGAAPFASPSFVRFKSMPKTVKLDIEIAAQFRQDHPRLVSLIERAAGIRDSLWKVLPQPAMVAAAKGLAKAKAKSTSGRTQGFVPKGPPGHFRIESLADIRKLVQKFRRFDRPNDFSCSWTR